MPTDKIKQVIKVHALGIEEPSHSRQHYASDLARVFTYQAVAILGFSDRVKELRGRKITKADRRYLKQLEQAANTFAKYAETYRAEGIENPVTRYTLGAWIIRLFDVDLADSVETAERIVEEKREAEAWFKSLSDEERAKVQARLS